MKKTNEDKIKHLERVIKEYEERIEQLEIEAEAHLEMLAQEEARCKAISEGNARKKKALREQIARLESKLAETKQ